MCMFRQCPKCGQHSVYYRVWFDSRIEICHITGYECDCKCGMATGRFATKEEAEKALETMWEESEYERAGTDPAEH